MEKKLEDLEVKKEQAKLALEAVKKELATYKAEIKALKEWYTVLVKTKSDKLKWLSGSSKDYPGAIAVVGPFKTQLESRLAKQALLLIGTYSTGKGL